MVSQYCHQIHQIQLSVSHIEHQPKTTIAVRVTSSEGGGIGTGGRNGGSLGYEDQKE